MNIPPGSGSVGVVSVEEGYGPEGCVVVVIVAVEVVVVVAVEEAERAWDWERVRSSRRMVTDN